MKGSQYWLDGSIVELLFILALIAFRCGSLRPADFAHGGTTKKKMKGQPSVQSNATMNCEHAVNTQEVKRDKMIIIRTLRSRSVIGSRVVEVHRFQNTMYTIWAKSPQHIKSIVYYMFTFHKALQPIFLLCWPKKKSSRYLKKRDMLLYCLDVA